MDGRCKVIIPSKRLNNNAVQRVHPLLAFSHRLLTWASTALLVLGSNGLTTTTFLERQILHIRLVLLGGYPGGRLLHFIRFRHNLLNWASYMLLCGHRQWNDRAVHRQQIRMSDKRWFASLKKVGTNLQPVSVRAASCLARGDEALSIWPVASTIAVEKSSSRRVCMHADTESGPSSSDLATTTK